jgi:hypothetical protein
MGYFYWIKSMIYGRAKQGNVCFEGDNGRIRPDGVEGAVGHRSLYLIERPGHLVFRDRLDQTVVCYVSRHEIQAKYVTTPERSQL